MNNNKYFKIAIIVLNILGIICLILFSIPYIRHDMSIPNPNSMLATYSWDTCGFILTIGFIPLLAVNILAYLFLKTKKKYLQLFFYLPSILCLGIIIHYLVFQTNWKKEETKEPVMTFKCVIQENKYRYAIYLEEIGEYSLEMDEKDKMPLSVVDYTDQDTIYESIKDYYSKVGGNCT